MIEGVPIDFSFVNQLFYGNNLDVLRRHVKDDTVDLVYLDPPFKSNQDYNVLFAEHGSRSRWRTKGRGKEGSGQLESNSVVGTKAGTSRYPNASPRSATRS